MTTGQTIGVADLGAGDREQMFQLLSGHYLGVAREAFERDLAGKEHVILLRSGEGEVAGFSTQVRFRMALPDRTVVAVFSGDTIVSERHRGTFETAQQICRYFRRALSDYPGEEIYWLLISKGWRTYRVPRLFFKDYAPREGAPDPRAFGEIADAFGCAKYPGRYDPATRLIVFPGETQRIRPGSTEAIDHRRSDPQMLFFEAANPEHGRGNELVCVAPIREDNFTAAARRLAGYAEVAGQGENAGKGGIRERCGIIRRTL
jgi:hypothetical protein